MATTSDRPKDILQRYDVWEPKTDQCDYQWKLRLLQSHWRAKKGLPMKYDMKYDKARGAELPIPEAKETLNNYLTQTIREVVEREVKGD